MPGPFYDLTTRLGLRMLKGTSEAKDIDTGFHALGEDLDKALELSSLLTVVHSASYEAKSGELGLQEKAAAVTTLPAGVKNAIVAVGAKGSSCKVSAPAGVFIYGLQITLTSKTGTIALAEGQFVILQFDGTNWLIIGGEPKEGRAVRTSATGEPAVASWGLIGQTGTVEAGSGDYTVSHPEEGKYIITWNVAKASAKYAVTITPAESHGPIPIPLVTSQTTKEVVIEIYTPAAAKLSNKLAFTVMAAS